MRKLETVVSYVLGWFMTALAPFGLGLTIWALQSAIFQGASGQATICSGAVGAWAVIILMEIKGFLKHRRERAAFDQACAQWQPQVFVPRSDEDEQA